MDGGSHREGRNEGCCVIELAMTVEEELQRLRGDTRAALAQSPTEKLQIISEPYTINTDVVIFIARRVPSNNRRSACITSIWHWNGHRIGWNGLRGKLRRVGAL